MMPSANSRILLEEETSRLRYSTFNPSAANTAAAATPNFSFLHARITTLTSFCVFAISLAISNPIPTLLTKM